MKNKEQITWEECINFSKGMWVALFYTILFLGVLIGITSILQIYVSLEISNKTLGLYRVMSEVFLSLFFFFSAFLLIDFIANKFYHKTIIGVIPIIKTYKEKKCL